MIKTITESVYQQPLGTKGFKGWIRTDKKGNKKYLKQAKYASYDEIQRIVEKYGDGEKGIEQAFKPGKDFSFNELEGHVLFEENQRLMASKYAYFISPGFNGEPFMEKERKKSGIDEDLLTGKPEESTSENMDDEILKTIMEEDKEDSTITPKIPEEDDKPLDLAPEGPTPDSQK